MTLDHALYGAAILGLAWAPFWFGSNRDVAWVINAAYFGAVVLLYEGSLLARKRAHPVAVKRLAFPVIAFVLVAVWIAVQASTLTPSVLHHPLWQWEREGLDIDLPGSITINRTQTYLALLRLLTQGCVFWLFLQLCRSPQRAHWTVQAVAVIGVVYAAYGIIAFYLFPRTILWFPKVAYLESVTSSFVNRNSYATYAGIGLICALAAALSHYVRHGAQVGRSLVRRLASFVASTAGGAGWWLVASFLLGMALVLTGSRGGILASLAGVLAFAMLGLLRGRGVITGLALFFALLAIAAALFTFGDLLAARLWSLGLSDTSRLAVYRLTILSILDAPWTGFGYGTFQTVFPLYRDTSVDPVGIWDKAHNTYLEIVQGLGIPFAALFLAGLLVLAGRCAYAALTRQSSATAPLAATSVTVIVALHCFVDFSMQIQAVALTWTALIGAGVAQSWRSTGSPS